jgi:hypothetical protein
MNKKRDPIDFCLHLRVRKSYYLGLPNDDYICVECGKSGSGPDWPKLERELQQRGLIVVSTRTRNI